MWNQTKFIKLLVEHNHNLLKLLREYEIDASTPDELPQPAPPLAPKSQFTPGSQSWFKQLPLPKTGDVVITSDAMARSAPKPRPPRAPGQQAMRSNGLWWRW